MSWLCTMVWIGVYNYFALKNVWNKNKLVTNGSNPNLAGADAVSVIELKGLRSSTSSPKPGMGGTGELDLLLPSSDADDENSNTDHIV